MKLKNTYGFWEKKIAYTGENIIWKIYPST